MSVLRDIFYVMKAKLMQHGPLMMTCREFDEFILDYLDGRLSRRNQLMFELHMRMCPICRDYVERYRQTIALEKAAFADPDAPVPSEVPEALVRAVMAARAGPDQIKTRRDEI